MADSIKQEGTMKKLLIYTSFAVVAASSLLAQDSGVDYDLFEKGEYADNGHTLPYRILWPENMEKGKKYPLFIYLHGMGQGGRDNEKQLQGRADLFLKPENRVRYPCIVLFPQAPFGRSFVHITRNGKSLLVPGFRKLSDEEENRNEVEVSLSLYGRLLYDLVWQLVKGSTTDAKRVYISGSSMGAFTTFELIGEHPELFAAAAPMSGGAVLAAVGRWAGKVPVWIVHGDKDSVIPVESSRIIVEELKKQGITNYRYSEYRGIKHHSWEKAFAEPDFLSWFFSKRKE